MTVAVDVLMHGYRISWTNKSDLGAIEGIFDVEFELYGEVFTIIKGVTRSCITNHKFRDYRHQKEAPTHQIMVDNVKTTLQCPMFAMIAID